MAPNLESDVSIFSEGLDDILVDKKPVAAVSNTTTAEDPPETVVTAEEKPVVEPKTAVVKPAGPVGPPEDVFKTKALVEDKPTTTTDVSSEDIEEPVELKSNSKARNAWAQLKKNLKAAEAKLAEVTKQQAAVKKDDTKDRELQELRQKIDSYEEKLGKFDLTSTRAFQEKYVVPLDRMYQRGINLLTRSGKTKEEADQVLRTVFTSQNFDEVQSVLSEEPVAIQGALTTMAADVDELRQLQTQAIQNWKQELSASAEQERRNMEAAVNKETGVNIGQALDQLKMEGSWLFLESNKDDNWNQQVADRIAAVQALMREADPVTRLKYLAEGVAARTYRELYEHEHNRAVKLDTELNRVLGVRPRVAGDTVQVPDSSPKPRGAVDPNAWLNENIRPSENTFNF